jgi:hypothetical protein
MTQNIEQVVVRRYTATELIERIRKCERIINSPGISGCVRAIYQQYRDRLWEILNEKFEAQFSDAAFFFIFQINASFTLNLK